MACKSDASAGSVGKSGGASESWREGDCSASRAVSRSSVRRMDGYPLAVEGRENAGSGGYASWTAFEDVGRPSAPTKEPWLVEGAENDRREEPLPSCAPPERLTSS